MSLMTTLRTCPRGRPGPSPTSIGVRPDPFDASARPAPGRTVDDVRLNDHEDRLYDWSTASWWRRPWASRIDHRRNSDMLDVCLQGLGLVAGSGLIQLESTWRIPDVSFRGRSGASSGEPILAFPTWPSKSSGQHPQGDGGKARSISKRAFVWSGTFAQAGSSTSTPRRTLHPADGLDAARRRRCPARFSVQVGELFECRSTAKAAKERTAIRKEKAAARSLRDCAALPMPGVCTDHAHHADPLSPGDFRRDR